MISILWYK